MKRILGLDLGTTSIGWAVVNEAEKSNEVSSIVRTGVRVIPITTDEESDFQKGKSITINADRTSKRGARRNLQRYKQRREELLRILKEGGLIHDDTILAEDGYNSTHSLWALRAKAASDRIPLKDLGRVLLSINKKRGYRSNRKAKDEADGQAIDSVEVAMKLYNSGKTPGEYALQLLNIGKKQLPDFYRSDLYMEFDKIWKAQQNFYPELLTENLKEKLKDKPKTATWAICKDPFNIEGKLQKGTAAQKRLEVYEWRSKGLQHQLNLEQLAIVLSDINGQISNSSGYLGAISDRSKQLIIKEMTVGQFLYDQLKKSQHTPLKNQVFYRQDYLDEFERIWEVQAKYHKELTSDLKTEIRDVVIFYQRRLRSQKGQLAVCELEQFKLDVEIDGKIKTKIVGPKVCPKSSPLFQQFKIWQILNNIELSPTLGSEEYLDELGGVILEEKNWVLDLDLKQKLFKELNLRDKLSSAEVLKVLGLKTSHWTLNYKEGIEGNRTNSQLFEAFSKILVQAGKEPVDLKKESAEKIYRKVKTVFSDLGINPAILDFNTMLKGEELEKQPAYLLWHLLYSYEGDNSRTGNEALLKKLKTRFGFDEQYGKFLTSVVFQDDHGSLSTKAIRKILPELMKGLQYNEACSEAGYNHSRTVTKEENEIRDLKERLELLPKNSLRNPIVEKILNQMVNVVNCIIATYGKPDEIRVELARELKFSAKERAQMTSGIVKATKLHDSYRKELKSLYPFNSGVRITRNDVIKYKLYRELSGNGYQTLYTNTYIPKDKLFSKEFDVEHIIPQAKLFDDSFSNKTLSARQINIDKGNSTAYDFLVKKYGEGSREFKSYLARVEKLYKDGLITSSKYKKLLMKEDDIPDGFIERDIRNTQYIAKKATQMLLEIVRTVTPTTGRITDKLREDWQLKNILKELNWDKYDKQGLTTLEKTKEGNTIRKIKGWTKRNDHRHHAMDAITVAFTRRSHIQYLNYLNARKDENHKKHQNIQAIEQKVTYLLDNKKRLFVPPIPLEDFRREVKKHLEDLLVSFKAKNKVATKNKNRIKSKSGYRTQTVLTPRGQLHKETVYGKQQHYIYGLEKVGPKFDEAKIKQVVKKVERDALLERLSKFDNNPKEAFGGKNSLEKNPIYLDQYQSVQLPHKVKVGWWEERFTIRKPIDPNLKIDKVIDEGVKRVLQKRLTQYGNDPNVAFTNLTENPIWINQEKGIQLKRVTISGVSNAEALHLKRNHLGKIITDNNGKTIPIDYVQTGNNHHVAIYMDGKGKLQEKVVPFYEAVERKNQGLHVIDREYNTHLNWQFLFTLKQNECFVLPNAETGFNPHEINLMDERYNALISPNLFRVQKIATKNYMFRHHLETVLIDQPELKNKAFVHFRSVEPLLQIAKVRINHIGKIVHVGEY